MRAKVTTGSAGRSGRRVRVSPFVPQLPTAPPIGVVAVRAAAGGVGSSSLAAGLAVRSAAQGRRVCLVSLGRGGPIEVLLGTETVAGLRWVDLAGLHGAVDGPAVWDGLPAIGPPGSSERLRLLAPDVRTAGWPDPPLMAAVIGALRRCADVLVIDAGVSEAAADVTTQIGHTVVLLPATAVGVAGAARWRGERVGAGEVSLVLRAEQGRGSLRRARSVSKAARELLGTVVTEGHSPGGVVTEGRAPGRVVTEGPAPGGGGPAVLGHDRSCRRAASTGDLLGWLHRELGPGGDAEDAKPGSYLRACASVAQQW